MTQENNILDFVGKKMTKMVKKARSSLRTLQKDQKALTKVSNKSELTIQFMVNGKKVDFFVVLPNGTRIELPDNLVKQHLADTCKKAE